MDTPTDANTVCEPVAEDSRRQFESAWRSGRPLPIESVLPANEHPAFFGTLEELVHIEMEFCW